MELIPFSVSECSLEAYLIKTSTRSRIIYWIILSAVSGGLLLLPFIYVDVSVQARGYFQTNIEKQEIFTPYQGKVVFSSIQNGLTVARGDTLLIIDAESIRAQLSSLLERIAENDSSIADLEKLTRLNIRSEKMPYLNLSTRRYRAEYDNLKNQQEIQYRKFQKRKSENDRNEILYRQQIIAKAEYENSEFLASSEKENLVQILLSQSSAWQNDLAIRKNESVKLDAELKEYNEALANRIILSPISGEIIKSSDVQQGSIVGSGLKIAEISPEGELVATCFVRPGEIGLIHEQQKVKIQVDAFNYNEWGMIEGNIIDVSDDMLVENGSEAYFRVKCKPEKTFLSLKNGYRAEVKKGMSLSTRIIVIRRDLFHLLFDKADKWFNPYAFEKSH